jgi:hypothetical protein
MDFNFTREQEMLRNMVREFVQKELAPRIPEFDEPEGEWPYDVFKRMGQLGLVGLALPKEFGGNAMGHVALMIAWEELAKVSSSWASNLRGFALPAYAISHYGPAWAQKEIVPKICRGEMQGNMTLTEDVGGSDMGAIRTTCLRDGDDYIINGRKIMQSRYSILDFFCPICRSGEKSYTFVIVPKGTPGIELGRRENYISAMTKTLPVGEVMFNNVRVPKENVIGEEGKGFRPVLAAVGAIGRLGGAGISLGLAEAAYEKALHYAKTRHLYGKPIIELQVIRWMLVDMETRVETAKYFCYYASWLLDQGKKVSEVAKEIARAKVVASETALDVCLKAIEIHGAYGTTPEFGVIQKMKSALDQITAAGSNQVMKRTIADAIASE